MGIGEALVTALDEKGRPTPLTATLMRAPKSRMDVLSPQELSNLMETSQLSEKYNKTIDRESAYEILGAKIKKINAATPKQKRKQMPYKRKSQRQNPVVKVLTSATFIRAVFGILKKVV